MEWSGSVLFIDVWLEQSGSVPHKGIFTPDPEVVYSKKLAKPTDPRFLPSTSHFPHLPRRPEEGAPPVLHCAAALETPSARARHPGN
jgi:hypothetical protein